MPHPIYCFEQKSWTRPTRTATFMSRFSHPLQSSQNNEMYLQRDMNVAIRLGHDPYRHIYVVSLPSPLNSLNSEMYLQRDMNVAVRHGRPIPS